MGEEVGLATLIVFLSMVFWGWLFGPVGMLLSVPLTIAVKFLSLRNSHTLWLAVLLSNTVEKTIVNTTPSADD
jgi:predicted PurR-regulated permease PerM